MSNHADSSWEIVIDIDTSSYFPGKCTIISRLAYISYLIMQFLKSKADQWHAWKANLEKNPKYKKTNDQQHQKKLLATYLSWSSCKQSSFSSGFCRTRALTASPSDRTFIMKGCQWFYHMLLPVWQTCARTLPSELATLPPYPVICGSQSLEALTLCVSVSLLLCGYQVGFTSIKCTKHRHVVIYIHINEIEFLYHEVSNPFERRCPSPRRSHPQMKKQLFC